MLKFLQPMDGSKRSELTPLSYEEFLYLGLWFSDPDSAYTLWKHHNGVNELSDFNEETLCNSILVVERASRGYEFNPSGDTLSWSMMTLQIVGNSRLINGFTKDEQEKINFLIAQGHPDAEKPMYITTDHSSGEPEFTAFQQLPARG